MRVLCNLPNAGDLINGVVFQATSIGMISDDLAPEVAARFLRIPGYLPVREEVAEPADEAKKRGRQAKTD